MPELTTGTAAGVPYVIIAPWTNDRSAPIVVAWHLLDPPRTEIALSAALPMQGLAAWRIYLGLPMSGSRLPEGGADEMMRRAFADPVINVHSPIAEQALAEFEPALGWIREHHGLTGTRVGVLGGSLGAAVAALVLTEGPVRIDAAVLVNPLIRLREGVNALSRFYEMTYTWTEESNAIADRLDFAARAGEIASRGEPAVRLIVGAQDKDDAFKQPATQVQRALAEAYADPSRVRLSFVEEMAHPLADEPGVDAAPQTAQAAEVDRLAVEWLNEHLVHGH